MQSLRPDEFYNNLVATGRIIDENTQPDDTIISLGINGYIYPFTERRPASKYFYQGTGVDLIPNSRADFIRDITSKKPKIIAIIKDASTKGKASWTNLPAWYAPIDALIKQSYTLLTDQNGWYLFIRK
jgi:hypothetical protein